MKSHGTVAGVLALLVAFLVHSLCAGAEPETTDTLREELRKLQNEIADLKKMQAIRDKVATAEFEALHARLTSIENLLKELKSSRSTRGTSSIPPAALPMGTIRIENRLGVRAEVTIDNVSYSIAPLSTQVLRDRPAGMFLYEVTADGYGVTVPKRTTLGANETWTLTIF